MAPLTQMGVSLLSLVSNSNHRNVGFKTSRQPYAKNRHTRIDISGDPQLPSFHTQHMMRTRLPCSYNAHSSTYLNLSQKAALTVAQSSGIGIEAIVSMSLLALQFGLQPSLTRKFTPKGRLDKSAKPSLPPLTTVIRKRSRTGISNHKMFSSMTRVTIQASELQTLDLQSG